MSLFLAGLAALLYGTADFAGGYASRKSATLSVLVFSQAAGVLLAVLALALGHAAPPSAHDLLWGAVAGVFGNLGLFMLYRGIATSLVAVVSPSSALVGALLPLAWGFFLGERPSASALVGALLCLPAVLLLSSGGGGANRKGVRSALAQGCAAGLGFGLFFIAISRTGKDSGLWPLLASRATSLSIVLLVLTARRQKPGIAPASLPSAIAAGFADMGANIFFLLATRAGLLSLVSVVTSLYPAPTVLLGRVFLRERIPVVRLVGLALALAGVVLISMK